MQTMNQEIAAQVVRPRAANGRKGTFGRVLIIAGNRNYGGAAIMSATASVYAGAGLTTVATDPLNWGPLHARLPEAMVTDWQPATLQPLIQGADVIVIGPGLGTDSAALTVLNLLISTVQAQQTVIIDGSAIDLFAREKLTPPHCHLVWTPHQMEWQRLSGIPIAQQNPTVSAPAAAQVGGIVVVKGPETQIFAPDIQWCSTAGGPWMATGGSGDTLTGVIAAFCAQFGYHAKVIAAAVWTHSAAASIVAENAYVALPTAVSAELPALMHELSRGSTN
ncbi:NAD(P)H-hydrate dehydratase [Lacticaseibacillus zhaodongensis]|uniref:NAD(P)H-hydrate dehydratase n=1 Tax=Lacticaseibacillus zhaodongensis TaxID=2668065 RepID=UPI0012D34777|nr:NAD(P)H-hydrate dehydratase [Lacticaseibacillus zhaodongensis]